MAQWEDTLKGKKKEIVQKLITLLKENESGLSNLKIKSSLQENDDDEKFSKIYYEIKNILFEEKIIQKFSCHSGGLRLTEKGVKYASKIKSSKTDVKSESDLYAPFIESLMTDIEENSENAKVINTSSMKRNGKWKNPDVVKVQVSNYPFQHIRKIRVISFEIKQYGKLDISYVFEAASHKRFAHESYLVFEWPKNVNEM